MSKSQVLKLLYASIAIFATYVGATRILDGEWTWAILPLIVVAFCVYRLSTLVDGQPPI